MLNKDILLIIYEFLNFKDKIILSAVNKMYNNCLSNETIKINRLIKNIYNIDHDNLSFEKDFERFTLKIFSEYNNNKIIELSSIFWNDLEERISNLKYNKNITGVHIEYFDRGVKDWDILGRRLREKFPNLKSINTDEQYGIKYNITDSDCNLVILRTSDEYPAIYSYPPNEKHLIYAKEITAPAYYGPEITYIRVMQFGNQFQVIISDE